MSQFMPKLVTFHHVQSVKQTNSYFSFPSMQEYAEKFGSPLYTENANRVLTYAI